MARKRMIDPNIWQSEDFSKLSTLAKLIFIGMFSNADDEGYGRAKPAYIKSVLFPYDETMRVIDVDKTLSEIASNMSVTFYSHDGNDYYSLDNWDKWQRVEKPQRSNIPPFDDHSETIRRTVGEESSTNRGAFPPKRKERKLIEVSTKEDILHGADKVTPCQNHADSVITLTLNNDTEYPITDSQVKEWTKLYPSVDIMQELRAMHGWCDANPKRRKTASGILRFVNSWLSNEQNNSAGKGLSIAKTNNNRNNPRPNRFANFDQRAWDFEAIEKAEMARNAENRKNGKADASCI